MLVYCGMLGCTNTAHGLIDGTALCSRCIDAMAAMNSDNEAWLRAALAVAGPFCGPEWVCQSCGVHGTSMSMLNGVCYDCRSVMPLLFVN